MYILHKYQQLYNSTTDYSKVLTFSDQLPQGYVPHGDASSTGSMDGFNTDLFGSCPVSRPAHTCASAAQFCSQHCYDSPDGFLCYCEPDHKLQDMDLILQGTMTLENWYVTQLQLLDLLSDLPGTFIIPQG